MRIALLPLVHGRFELIQSSLEVSDRGGRRWPMREQVRIHAVSMRILEPNPAAAARTGRRYTTHPEFGNATGGHDQLRTWDVTIR